LGDVTGRGRWRWWPSWRLAVLERVGLVVVGLAAGPLAEPRVGSRRRGPRGARAGAHRPGLIVLAERVGPVPCDRRRDARGLVVLEAARSLAELEVVLVAAVLTRPTGGARPRCSASPSWRSPSRWWAAPALVLASLALGPVVARLGPSWRSRWGRRRGPHLEHAPRGATRASARSSSPPAGEGDHGRGHALALPCPHLAPAVLRPRGQLPPLPFLPQPLGALPRVPLDLLSHDARRIVASSIDEVRVAGRGLRALVSEYLPDLRERQPGLPHV